jgi:hypothetical protein
MLLLLITYDALAVYVPCFQSTLGSLGYRFQSGPHVLFSHCSGILVGRVFNKSRTDVIEICIKNKDVHLVGILKKCLMYQNAQKGKLLNNCITMSIALQRLGQESNNIK